MFSAAWAIADCGVLLVDFITIVYNRTSRVFDFLRTHALFGCCSAAVQVEVEGGGVRTAVQVEVGGFPNAWSGVSMKVHKAKRVCLYGVSAVVIARKCVLV